MERKVHSTPRGDPRHTFPWFSGDTMPLSWPPDNVHVGPSHTHNQGTFTSPDTEAQIEQLRKKLRGMERRFQWMLAVLRQLFPELMELEPGDWYWQLFDE